MRHAIPALLAIMLACPPAFGADDHAPLPPGKPAGTKAAELDVTNTVVIATTAAILVTAIVLGITQKDHTNNATSTSPSQ